VACFEDFRGREDAVRGSVAAVADSLVAFTGIDFGANNPKAVGGLEALNTYLNEGLLPELTLGWSKSTRFQNNKIQSSSGGVVPSAWCQFRFPRCVSVRINLNRLRRFCMNAYPYEGGWHTLGDMRLKPCLRASKISFVLHTGSIKPKWM
jgi:hypothetical protein